MWRPILVIIIIFAALYGGYYFMNKPEITEIDDTPINPDKEPYQSYVTRPFAKPFQKGNLNLSLSPQANYSISARLLSKRRYVRGWEAKLSEWDFVLGWGEASKLDKIENLKIRQSVRWYSFKISADVPMPGPYISTHTSNHHIIPNSENVRRALLFLKKFDVVQLKGYLVNVHGKDNDKQVNWITSKTRKDTGDGACEIFLVESVKIGENIYK
ncbi:hypothetical protein ACFLYJ_03020 [Candidatus Cloacimonadota bacterium]